MILLLLYDFYDLLKDVEFLEYIMCNVYSGWIFNGGFCIVVK